MAGVGSLADALAAKEVFAAESAWVVLMIALATGLVGALLSAALQYAVIAVAGFLAGAYLLRAVALACGWGEWGWIGFLAGGVVGTVLILAVVDRALITLSTLVWATVIAQNTPLDNKTSALLFVILCVVGFLVQVGQMRRRMKAA